MGETPRDLTLEDAGPLRICRRSSCYAPLNVGVAELASSARLREVTVMGSTADMLSIRHMKLAQGSFLSREKGTGRSAQIVLGAKLAQEFFPQASPIGQRVRLGDRRFLVSGVFAPQGETMGFNTDEIVIIPIDYAQALFNTSSLFRILVETRSRSDLLPAKEAIRDILKQRHDGEEDVTVITHDAVLATFDRILRALTLGVAGIAAISLAVAGILVMNVMLVSVSQRTSEIGLLKALRRAFRRDPPFVSCRGVVVVIGGRDSGVRFGAIWKPADPAGLSAASCVAARMGQYCRGGSGFCTGLLASLIPAARAARLDPVRALSGK